MNKLIKSAEKLLEELLSNVYINTSLKVFIALYAALAAPRLPKMLQDLFNNMVFRIVVAFLIVLLATKDASLALMVALAFIITLYSISKTQLMETDLSISLPNELSWLPSAKVGSELFQESVEVTDENQEPTTEMFSQQSELLANSSPEIVPGSDQTSCIKTWKNEMCIQGIERDAVGGVDKNDKFASF